MRSRFSLFLSGLQLFLLWSCRVQNNPPELTRLTPPKGFVGTEISLQGYQFGSDPAVLVGNGETAVTAPITAKDENSIRAVVPVVPPGPTLIRVRTDQGTSDPLPFVVQQPVPSLTSIAPGNGLTGTVVALTGNYLNQIRAVRFGNAVAVVRDSAVQKITVVVPPNLPRGPLVVVVETAGGSLSGNFIVAGTPRISQVLPKVTRPGAEFIIQGSNLTDGIVRINDQQMERSLTTVSDTEIKTIIPPFAKSGRITVTVFEKLVATSVDTVQIIQPPFVTNIGAQEGIAGDKLLLPGNNLGDVTAVSFNNTPAQFRVVNANLIEAIVPKLPVSGPTRISVSSVGGNHTAGESFFFFQLPGAITVSPLRQLRTQTITITGQNLHRITDVRINGQSVPISDRVEGSQLFVNVAANGTSGPVTVVNRAGSVVSARPLVVVQKPLVTDIIPAKARPGDRVVLRGDFLLDARIFFNGTTLPATDGGKNEDTERWVLLPANAQTGPLRIANIAGETTTSGSFTVLRLVSNLDFSPKTAKAGDVIVLTGQNLTSTQAVRFTNGSSSAAKFLIDAGGQFVVTVPADAATGQICLTNEAGTACTSANLVIGK